MGKGKKAGYLHIITLNEWKGNERKNKARSRRTKRGGREEKQWLYS